MNSFKRATKHQIIQIHALLSAHCVKTVEGRAEYYPPYDDDAIATQTGAPKSTVQVMRREMFGNLRSEGNTRKDKIAELEIKVAELITKVEATDARLTEDIAQYNKLMREGEEKIKRLEKKIETLDAIRTLLPKTVNA